jgi:putative salt-induced outer membrane protein YdiY
MGGLERLFMQVQRILFSLGTFVAASTWNGARGVAQYTGPVAVAQHTETVAAPPSVPNQLLVNIAAGATLNSGNTKAYAANLGGRLNMIRHPHQLTVEVLGTLGWARPDPEAEVEQTAANMIGRGRYDIFLSKNDALFLAVQPRRDTFAGLNIRLQTQAGYLRNLFNPSDAHRLWTELGYDFTYDDFAEITTAVDITADVLADNPDLMLPPDSSIAATTSITRDPGHDFVHSGRAFLGYTNAVHPMANVNLGVEALFDVEDGKNVRVNGLAEVTSSISAHFKLGIQSRLFYDNVPVPGKEKTDLVIAAQLVYTFDSLAGVAAPPAAPCDCSAAVEAARVSCQAPPVSEPAPLPAPPAPEGQAPTAPEGTAPSAPVAPATPAAPAAPAAPATPAP